MPELPEVETMRRLVLPAVGREIDQVRRPSSRYRPLTMSPPWPSLQRQLVGQRIIGVERIAKRVIVWLSDARGLVIQPKMAGLVLLDEPPSREHVRLQLQLSGEPQLCLTYWDRRGLGTIHLWTADEVAEQLGPDKLGPDALAISLDQLRERLGSLRRPVKVALLDQTLVAGIGNLYASEILHAAGVHPELVCAEITPQQWRRIHQHAIEILNTAIVYEGSTLSDGTYRKSLTKTGSYQNAHRVYARADQTCLSCGRETVVCIRQAQRSTFFCPRCQPLRRRLRRPPSGG
jgi:formamidopyrimidine-DNA glycosylase